ncbi:Transmembrane domain-containing protein [Spironucleus salmonicida]|uniref:Transmembrane domain-containing protein n=1 Tax=Spironucleus salmonicida TaxID=348837 RepID=V6LWL5_9EUKA|nr:Transmembrane domain-containing protein [Spironucleus salmonicida]|eukprot:EST45174.1 Transmembrane domain-containing protein [Spironucleus salmonicida]
MSETFISVEKLPSAVKKYLPVFASIFPLLFLSNLINLLSMPFNEFCYISDTISLLPVFYFVITLAFIISQSISFICLFFVLKCNSLQIIIFSSLQLVCLYAYFLGMDLNDLRENIAICFD